MAARSSNPVHYQGDLRSDLIRAALKVIEAEGTAGVSLRGLTRSLGVSHAAPKNHFATKELLFAEIAREGFVIFEQKLRAAGDDAISGGFGPIEVLNAQGMAYLDFVRDFPSHFALMFRTDLYGPSLIQLETGRAFAVLQDAVGVAQRSGWHRDVPPETAAGLLWSTLHGQSQLEARGMPIGANLGDRSAILRLLLGEATSS